MPPQDDKLKTKIELLRKGDVVKFQLNVHGFELTTVVGRIEQILSLPGLITGKAIWIGDNVLPVLSEMITEVTTYEEKPDA